MELSVGAFVRLRTDPTRAETVALKTGPKLSPNESCLDRLSETHLIGNQQAVRRRDALWFPSASAILLAWDYYGNTVLAVALQRLEPPTRVSA
jgi:hypothetical protein